MIRHCWPLGSINLLTENLVVSGIKKLILMIGDGPECTCGWELIFGEGDFVFLPAVEKIAIAVLNQQR